MKFLDRRFVKHDWSFTWLILYGKIHVVIQHTMTPYDICSITEDWSRKKLIRIIAKIAKTQEGVSW